MDIPSDKIDLESRKSSRKNRELVEYFHYSNNNFIDSLREHAKFKSFKDPKVAKEKIIGTFKR